MATLELLYEVQCCSSTNWRIYYAGKCIQLQPTPRPSPHAPSFLSCPANITNTYPSKTFSLQRLCGAVQHACISLRNAPSLSIESCAHHVERINRGRNHEPRHHARRQVPVFVIIVFVMIRCCTCFVDEEEEVYARRSREAKNLRISPCTVLNFTCSSAP